MTPASRPVKSVCVAILGAGGGYGPRRTVSICLRGALRADGRR